MTYAVAGFPPTVLFHGTADTTLALKPNSMRLFDVLSAAGTPVELHAIEGAPHEFDRHPELATGCAYWADLFLERHLINPMTYPPFVS